MEIFKLVFSPIEVNTYILADKSGCCAIIDCGCFSKAEFERFTGFINQKNLTPVLLLNTHCHIDHIFGNKWILEKYKLRTFCHKKEEKNRKNSVEYALFFGLTMDQPPEPEGAITDGQVISFGTSHLLALHVPGHSPGSLSFYSKPDEVVFTGDALFAGSIGRTDLPGGDFETLIESIKSKLFVLPPATKVYPGHGEATTIENEMNYNPFLK
ncbi:MAG: MBL fold metallo-hydrolase [Bacteroidales bacterium]|nr:MBL fold metallo-hydrolase [Bacteroidales bacterium]